MMTWSFLWIADPFPHTGIFFDHLVQKQFSTVHCVCMIYVLWWYIGLAVRSSGSVVSHSAMLNKSFTHMPLFSKQCKLILAEASEATKL